MLDLALAVIVFALSISLGYSMVLDGYKQTREDADIVLEDKNTSKLDSTDSESMTGNNYYETVDSGEQAIMMIIVQNKLMYGPKRLFIGDKIYEITDSIKGNLTTYVNNTSASFESLKATIESNAVEQISSKANYNLAINSLKASSTEEDILKNETLALKSNQVVIDRDLEEYFDHIDKVNGVNSDWMTRLSIASTDYINKSNIEYNGHNYIIKVKYVLTIEDSLKTAIGETEGCHIVKAMYYLDDTNK